MRLYLDEYGNLRRTRYLLIIFLLLWGFRFLPAQAWQRFEYTEPKMGTIFRLVLYASDRETADTAAAAAFRRIDTLNLIFSDYQEESEVSKLSETAGSGQKIAVSSELWEVLQFSKKLSKKSKGAFDVTIGPLSKLWRRAFRQQEFPEITKILEAKELVDYRQIKLYPKGHRVRLGKAGMHLDFGGIAKGFTVDAVYQILQANGIAQALVDGGGDIYAGAPPPGASAWEIELFSEAQDRQQIHLTNRAIASSGSTYKYLEWQGQRYSHIVDPRTGLGVTGNDIINVSAPNCMQADAFASALSVLSPKNRVKLLRKFQSIDWIDGTRYSGLGTRR